MEDLTLLGKVVVKGKIKAITGLHVGGTTTGLKVGGVDLGVITDPLGKPYVPGSSLKGKMRSLMEKTEGKMPNKSMGENVKIHQCQNPEDYANCVVCRIWGLPGEKEFATPTRLIVRDAFLDEESLTEEMKKNIDLEWTEVKFENVIDRMRSSAMPRQIERVPAGTTFSFEMIYNILQEQDKDDLKKVFESMKLLEDDYLGGHGSRGYGQIKFEGIEIYRNKKEDYEAGTTELKPDRKLNANFDAPSPLLENFDRIIKPKL